MPSQYPVNFSGKPIVSEESLNQMVEALGITIDRRPKGRSRKMEKETREKIGCIPILNINKLCVIVP